MLETCCGEGGVYVDEGLTIHVVTTAVLFDVDAAFWTGFGTHAFYCVFGCFVFEVPGFVAVGVWVPGTVAG
jgi:hypothetical protein